VAEALGFLGPEHGVLQTLSARITLAAAYAKYLRDFERQEMPDEEVGYLKGCISCYDHVREFL
jgi:hypothetical protein